MVGAAYSDPTSVCPGVSNETKLRVLQSLQGKSGSHRRLVSSLLQPPAAGNNPPLAASNNPPTNAEQDNSIRAETERVANELAAQNARAAETERVANELAADKARAVDEDELEDEGVA
jgi:hypothetical protein